MRARRNAVSSSAGSTSSGYHFGAAQIGASTLNETTAERASGSRRGGRDGGRGDRRQHQTGRGHGDETARVWPHQRWNGPVISNVIPVFPSLPRCELT